jgi:membrane fusion protein, multidrug efflux system
MVRGNRWTGAGLAGLLIMLGLIVLLTGCKQDSKKETPPVPLVEVVNVKVKDVPIYSEWTASLDGYVNATIRAQVQGYLIERDYKEGDFVKKGQGLFKIDPRFFQAALEQAKGHLTEQRARWENAKANLERIKPLVEQKAVSMKDLDDAIGTEQATHAALITAQAIVDKAQVDLGFTKITSPIDGIAGIARAQLGNLVGPGSIEELATVSTVDPIKLYVPMSEQEYLKYLVNGRNQARQLPLELILADDRLHPHRGTFAFAARSVDVKTGTIKVAALFKNPGNVLRPGQFARVRARTLVKKGALLVPQRAVTELQGKYQVAVVGSDNKVAIRLVNVGERFENFWLLEEGLKSGERVIVEGLQKVKPGMVVSTKPFNPESGTKPEIRPQGTSAAEVKTGTRPGSPETGKR